jgi:hypothetical protein
MNNQRQAQGCPHGELAIGWALHSLEPAEESLVTSHLPDCSACRGLAAQTEEVGAMLGLSVPEMVPSAGLEQRILSVTGTQGIAPVVPLASAAPSAPVFSWFSPVKLVAAAAVALVAVAVGLGVRLVQLDSQLNQVQRQARAIAEALQSAADPGAALVPLATKDGRRVGMVLASGGQVVVMPTGLTRNRVADQTYVLWGLASQTPIALAVFDVSGGPTELHTVPSATSRGSFAGYAISLEPGRRAPVVPTQVVASGQVTS